tara:strand:+ start:252 stop:461 length:210 start_codon:yes stop_codon:yes gene_type:complete
MNAKRKKLPAILDVYYDDQGRKVTVYETPEVNPKHRTWASKGAIFARGNQKAKFGKAGRNIFVEGHKGE